MKHTLSSIYIPHGESGSFYYTKNDRLVSVYISARTGRALSIPNSYHSCLRELEAKLIKEGISYINTTATNPEELISLHPEYFI